MSRVCLCSSCDWRPFQTEPGSQRSCGGDGHRRSAGVSSCFHMCLITNIDHCNGPAHHLFNFFFFCITSCSVISLHITDLLIRFHKAIYFFNRCRHLLICVFHVLAVCSTSVSTLAGSCGPFEQPSVTQLNPLPSFSLPRGARGTHMHCRQQCFGY